MRKFHSLVLIILCCFSCYSGASPAEGLNIALTNDDGWEAVGIQVLQRALEVAGHKTTIAAPAGQESDSGSAKDTTGVLVTRKAENQFAVAACLDDVCSGKISAKPFTSGLVAIDLSRRRSSNSSVDLLISGINQGSTIGFGLLSSGIFGAMSTAISRTVNSSIPAIGISTEEPAECGDWTCIEEHYAQVATFVVQLVATLQTRASATESTRLLPEGMGLNVNYPSSMPKGVQVVTHGEEFATGSGAMVVEIGCEGCAELAVGESAKPSYTSVAPDTQVAVNGEAERFKAGYITIVPMNNDITANNYEKFTSWFDEITLQPTQEMAAPIDLPSQITDDKDVIPGTYRYFTVQQAGGVVTDLTPIPEVRLPRWARNVQKQDFDWSETTRDAPFFARPIPFVLPPEDNGETFRSFNHQPSITWLPNGDLLAIWYSTTREVGPELTVLASRLRQGADSWDPSSEFFKAANRNMHGSSIFHDGNGVIYHFNGMGPAARDGWERLALLMRTSRDNGVTWTPPRAIGRQFKGRHQVISGTLMTSSGVLIQNCDASPFQHGGTALHISHDGGQSWEDPGAGKPLPDFSQGIRGEGTIAGIHGKVVELGDGRLLAMGRGDTIDGHMPMSLSSDMGKTWTYHASPFPPIGEGQRLVLRRLQGGELLLVSFTDRVGFDGVGIGGVGSEHRAEGMEFVDQRGNRFIGRGMYAAVSFDDGKSWPVRKLLTPGSGKWHGGGWQRESFTSSSTQAEPIGYLAGTQTPDGMIHLISSRLHYRFNLSWLIAGTSAVSKRER